MDKDQLKYNPSEIEAKWQEIWEKEKIFSPNVSNSQKPFYNLMMFPYPSAEGLHVGNMYAFTGADVYARYIRMLGKDVFEPIGLDGFGIHSENYALKVGRHPKEQAGISEANFYRQLRSIGNSFDWERTLETYNPDYYRWTQWLFIQLFKAGLAYRKAALVNWCPSCKTVLSDEQVIDGKCERCGTIVEKRDLEQWFFRITNYSERLLNNIDSLNWTEKVKTAQRNWIGKSEGAEISFELVADSLEKKNKEDLKTKSSKLPAIKVFTTRPDTLYGATFMVLSPEHELVDVILNSFGDPHTGKPQNLKIPKQVRDDVFAYVEAAKNKSEAERTAEGKAKTGIDIGLKAINPVNDEKIPIWIADYVLSGYGTGAIMAVPAHDERDFEFAKKYGLKVVQVIEPISKDDWGPAAPHPHSQSSDSLRAGAGGPPVASPLTNAYVGPGKLINSGEWDGFEVPKDMGKVIDNLESRGLGTRKANFHLRDWLISRQRYWGPPIPLVFCENCASKIKNQKEKIKEGEYSRGELENPGWIAVHDDQLPVLLPDVEDWRPEGTGKSPLANHPEFYKTTCPNCKNDAVRETDVSDTFLDSSWYFLRYPSINDTDSSTKDNPDSESGAFDAQITKNWLPVDQYIGGAEHSVLHLLYSRFITMALKDMGHLDFEEPFTNFFAHGLIIKDGAKMSKSKGNVVVPDVYIGKYGADTLRAYLMFIGPYSDGGDFRDSGIEGMNKFMRKVWKFVTNHFEAGEGEIDMYLKKLTLEITEEISNFRYNTAISRIMMYYNFLAKKDIEGKAIYREELLTFIKLLAPFAPYMAEELWQNFTSGPAAPHPHSQSSDSLRAGVGGPPFASPEGLNSIHLSSWPQISRDEIEKSLVMTVAVSVNGKTRATMEIEANLSQDEAEKRAREIASKHLDGVEVKKVIYVPGKIINFVV